MRRLPIIPVALLLVIVGCVRPGHSADNAKPEYQPKLLRGPAAPGKNGPAAPGKNGPAAPGKKVLATGTIEPEEVVDVCAPVAGTIASFGADPRSPGKSIGWNSPVEVGTVLAQIDSDLYAARVERERAGCVRAEAELAQARINLERAEAQWKRAQGLEKSKATPGPDFDLAALNDKAAKASVTVAEAALAQNKAALKQAEIELGYTTIKSPVKGTVIDCRVNVGQMVGPANTNSSLFLIGKLDKLVVWASVNEADIARVHEKQAVRFTVDAISSKGFDGRGVNRFPGKVFEGKVEQIRMNATMTQNVVTYTVVVAISGTPKELLPYMTANVEFE
jgi:HlyD family secretion protein